MAALMSAGAAGDDASGADSLVDFQDARRLHHRRFLLAIGEALGAFPINVNARELFAVVIVHSDLPVAMFASSVLGESAGLPTPLLFHDGLALKAA